MAQWAKDLDLEEGKLRGWAADQRPSQRRAALRKSVDADGYATTMRRLQVLINLDSPQKVQSAARADMEWMRRTFREEETTEEAPAQEEGMPWRTRQI